MSSVGILAASYSGSTRLGVELNRLPGVHYVGETHWIVDAENAPACRCRGECREMGDAFKQGLRDDGSNWWARMAKNHGADVVVSGDKVPHNYANLGPTDKFIVLYRRPASWVVSWIHHHRLMAGQDCTLLELRPTDDDVAAAINVFNSHYEGCVNLARANRSPCMTLCWSDFIDDPDGHMAQLAEFFGVPDERVEKTCHHVGGNTIVNLKKLPKRYPRYYAEKMARFSGDRLMHSGNESALTDAQRQTIEDCIEVNRLW